MRKKLIFLVRLGGRAKPKSSQNLKEQPSPAKEIPGESWGCSRAGGAAGRWAGPLTRL